MSIITELQGRRYRSFNPTDIAGLVQWFSADMSAGYTSSLASGNTVTTWSDLSGNNRSPTQTTPANRPTLVANSIATKNAISFDGTNDTLTTLTAPYYNLSQGTFFVVCNRTTDTGFNSRVFAVLASGAERIRLRYNAGNNAMEFFWSSNGTGSGVASANIDGGTTNYAIICAFRTGNTVGISINGGADSLNTNTNATITDATNFSLTVGTVNRLAGNIACYLAYDSYLNAQQRRQVINYLSNYYGIAIS